MVAGSMGMGLVLTFKDFASKGMKTAEKNFGKLDDATERGIKTQKRAVIATKVGAGAMIGGAGIIFALKKTVDESAKYSHAMTKFQAVSGATTKAVQSMSKNFLEYSAALPVSAHEMAEVAMGAARMGIFAEQGQKGTEAFSIAIIELGSVMETVPIDELSRSVGKMMGLFRTAPEDLGRLTSALLYTASSSKVTESELLDTTEGLLGLSRMMNWTEAQTIGMAGAIGDAATTSQVGASAMTRFFSLMATDMDKFAKFVGISEAELRQKFRKDAPATLGLFIDKLKSMSGTADLQLKALDELGLGGVRVGRALMGLGGIQTSLQEKMAAATKKFDEGTYSHEQFLKVTESLTSKSKTAAGSVSNLGIIMGKILEPAVIKITDAVINLLSWLINLSPATQKAVTFFAAGLGIFLLVGGALAVMGGMATYAAVSIGGLGKVFMFLNESTILTRVYLSEVGDKIVATSKKAALAAATGIKKFASSLVMAGKKALAFSITLIRNAAAAVASFAVTMATTAVAGIVAFTAALVPAIAGAWAFTVALLANPITWIVLGIVALIAGIVLLVMNWDKVSAALGVAWEWMKNVFSVMWEGVKKIAVAVKEKIGGAFIAIWEGMKRVAIGIKESIGSAFAWIWDKATGLKDKIVGVFEGIKTVITGIWSTAVNVFKWAVNKYLSYLNVLLLPFRKIAHKIGITIPEIPKFDVGGTVTLSPNFEAGAIPRGIKVPAMLEAGERVAPVGAAGAESLSSPFRQSSGAEIKTVVIEMPVYLDGREIYRSIKEVAYEEASQNFSVKEKVGRGTE